MSKQLQAIINGQGEPCPAVPGSEITISLGDCELFLQEFCGLQIGISQFYQPQKPEGFFWPVPCAAALSYDRLADVVRVQQLPHYPQTLRFLLQQVDRSFDCRRPEEDGNYLLWTPAGIEANQACPELRAKSFRELWQMKEEVLSCREALILYLLIFWKTKGQAFLDSKGLTRTGSRDVDNRGVCVLSNAYGLRICWEYPDNADPNGGARFAVPS
ncbi:MAG: hypothetical protein Q8P45_03105 [Candidatus Harrisonbacteria bacterium]|nr:hypothetical protein [Candidatus Harrisonbacteria bacterium]